MLNKKDLTEIEGIVTQVVTNAIQENNKSEIFPRFTIIEKDLAQVKKTLKAIPLNIRKDINRAIDFFDRENLDIQRRIDRMEQRLDISHGN